MVEEEDVIGGGESEMTGERRQYRKLQRVVWGGRNVISLLSSQQFSMMTLGISRKPLVCRTISHGIAEYGAQVLQLRLAPILMLLLDD